MTGRWGAWVLVLASGVASGPSATHAAELPPKPWLVVRAERPDVEVDRLIGLFRGARAPHPAAALAAWKHATGGRGSLGKPVEAAIAALNPLMVPELRALDRATVRVSVDPATGRPVWRAVAPNDDGALAAFATALALTTGEGLDPIGEVSVYRSGRPGSALLAVRPGLFVVAPTLDELRDGLGPVAAADLPAPGAPGWSFRVDPAGLRAARPLHTRRIVAALDAVGARSIDGRLGLEGESLNLALTTRMADGHARPGKAPSVEPSWFAGVPCSGVLAAFATAFGGKEEDVALTFALLDRVEKADPARENVVPVRVRLNLIAAAARVSPEVDLWPSLRGVTVVVLADAEGRVAGGLLGLHASDPAAAARIGGVVLPRMAAAYLRAKPGPENADGSRPLGSIGGRPLAAASRGASVWVGLGDGALAAGLKAVDQPEFSAAKQIPVGQPGGPQRAGAFWPWRSASLVPPGSAPAKGLADAPPVLWQGFDEGPGARDEVVWRGLDGVVRRWLDALPLQPPPDRAGVGRP